MIEYYRRDDGGFTPIYGAIVSRNEAAVKLLIANGCKLDIRGSKKDIKNGKVFTPAELAKALGFSKFEQIQQSALKKETSKNQERDKTELEMMEAERKEKEAKQREAQKEKEAKQREAQKEEEAERLAAQRNKKESEESEKRTIESKKAENQDYGKKEETSSRKPETNVTDPKQWVKKYKASKNKKEKPSPADNVITKEPDIQPVRDELEDTVWSAEIRC